MMTCPSVPAIPTLWLFSILLLVVSLNAQNKKPSNEDKVPDTTLFTSFPGTVVPRSPRWNVPQCLT
ncbi:cDNA sequence BC010462, isoform CRA_a [Mus musculus]|uniref:Secreted and transmembrane 1A n=1 Tax=Mus musculus TaxID=10090 RepID=Q3TBH1_MOUSE|nr:cDNA sequence BC010462, isoform CRA_a [Mus musculus]BAE41606.1 unnamed protein product [Mus musculus]BAE42339.1 unnamed protein product [Mus musculus]